MTRFENKSEAWADMRADAERCRKEQQPAHHEDPVCEFCGGKATCLGRYEGAREDSYACDACCGHGCEDGRHPEKP